MKAKTLFALALGLCFILTSSFVKNESSAEKLASDKTFIDLLAKTRARELNKLSIEGKKGILKDIKSLKKKYSLFNRSKESTALFLEAFNLTKANQKNAVQMQPTCLEMYFLEFSICTEQYAVNDNFNYAACESAAWGMWEVCSAS